MNKKDMDTIVELSKGLCNGNLRELDFLNQIYHKTEGRVGENPVNKNYFEQPEDLFDSFGNGFIRTELITRCGFRLGGKDEYGELKDFKIRNITDKYKRISANVGRITGIGLDLILFGLTTGLIMGGIYYFIK